MWTATQHVKVPISALLAVQEALLASEETVCPGQQQKYPALTVAQAKAHCCALGAGCLGLIGRHRMTQQSPRTVACKRTIGAELHNGAYTGYFKGASGFVEALLNLRHQSYYIHHLPETSCDCGRVLVQRICKRHP